MQKRGEKCPIHQSENLNLTPYCLCSLSCEVNRWDHVHMQTLCLSCRFSLFPFSKVWYLLYKPTPRFEYTKFGVKFSAYTPGFTVVRKFFFGWKILHWLDNFKHVAKNVQPKQSFWPQHIKLYCWLFEQFWQLELIEISGKNSGYYKNI